MSLLVYTWLVVATVAQVPAASEPSDAEITRTIAALGDERFSARERATEQLWQWGDAAEPALQLALKHSDPEIRVRAKTILDRFAQGIYVDTPAETVAAIRQYRSGQQQQKIAAVERLKSLEDWRTLRRLQRHESDAAVRNHISGALRGEVMKELVLCFENDDLDQAERLLKESLDPNDRFLRRALITLYVLRDQVGREVELAKAELKREPTDQRRWWLAALHQAAGDAKAARAALADLTAEPHRSFLQVAREDRDWRQAAALADKSEGEDKISQLAYAATLHRLAGDLATADERLSEMAKLAAPKDRWYTQKVLLLNEKYDEAIEGLKQARPSMAFELLCMRHAFEDAFELANVRDGQTYDEAWFNALPIGEAVNSDARLHLDTRHVLALQCAYFLHQVGKTKDADAIFALLRELPRDGAGGNADRRRAELCRIQLRLGRDDDAYDDLAEHIARSNQTGLIATVFARQGGVAVHWYTILQAKLPDDSPRERLEKICLLIRPTPKQKQTEDWRPRVAHALEAMPAEKSPARIQFAETIAEAYIMHGQQTTAVELLTQPNLGSLQQIKAADLLREDGKYAEAAEIYAKSAAVDPHYPLALYLRGVCEAAQGKQPQATRYKQHAVLLAIEDGQRQLLLQNMVARRLTDEAIYLHQLYSRTSPELTANYHRQFGDILADHDPATAAELWSAYRVLVVGRNASLTEDAAYLSLLHATHRARLKACITSRDKPGYERELAACLNAMPYSWEMIEDVVPKLDAAGWNAEADALFDSQLAKVRDLVKKYPHSPRFTNAVAWISATCRRNLDEAALMAARTLELSPDNASYLDTLAEVHFARGEPAKAVQVQRRAVELSSLPLFRERLAKFEAAAAAKP